MPRLTPGASDSRRYREKNIPVTGRRNLWGDVSLGVEFRVQVLGEMVRGNTISSPSTHELGVMNL
jgi:hypothetical protein